MANKNQFPHAKRLSSGPGIDAPATEGQKRRKAQAARYLEPQYRGDRTYELTEKHYRQGVMYQPGEIVTVTDERPGMSWVAVDGLDIDEPEFDAAEPVAVAVSFGPRAGEAPAQRSAPAPVVPVEASPQVPVAPVAQPEATTAAVEAEKAKAVTEPVKPHKK